MSDITLHGRKAHVRHLWKQAWKSGTAKPHIQWLVYLNSIKGAYHADGIHHYFLPTEAAARDFIRTWTDRLKGKDQVWFQSLFRVTPDALPQTVDYSIRLPAWHPLSEWAEDRQDSAEDVGNRSDT